MSGLVDITEAAAARIAELQAASGGKVLRLSVRTAGCSGNRYDLAYADAPIPGDDKVEAHGAELWIDPKSLLFIAGTVVDWKDDGFSRSFEFTNPNETGRCGCGESFTTSGCAR